MGESSTSSARQAHHNRNPFSWRCSEEEEKENEERERAEKKATLEETLDAIIGEGDDDDNTGL